MTPDELWVDMAQFDGAHADRIWDGSVATEDAPAWYGRVATLLRAAAAPATEDELAGESDIVARMQAAILDPATEDELAGESDIVARMQATILELPPTTADDDARDSDRPRHLRAAVPSDARRRQGVRVVRRIMAVKAAAVTTAVAIGVTAAAATTGIVTTVVMPALSGNEPKFMPEPKSGPAADSGSSTDGSGADDGDGDGTSGEAVVKLENGEPLACIFKFDCLLKKVEEVTGVPTAQGADAVDSGAAVDGAKADPSAGPDETVPSETPVTTAEALVEPPTTTTTELTTTTTESTTTTSTTTTTQPPADSPPPEAAAPQPDTLIASGDKGGGAGDTAGRLRASGRQQAR